MLGYAQPLDFRTTAMTTPSMPDMNMGAVLDLRKAVKTEHDPHTAHRPLSTSPPSTQNRPCSTSTTSSALGSPTPILRYSPVPQVQTHIQHHHVQASHMAHQSELPMMLTLTPPRDSSLSPPVSSATRASVAIETTSPGLAVAQRVLAAASAPASGTRPFKAYPRDPLALSAHSESYLQFRQHMLKQVRGNNAKGTPPSRKRSASPSSPQQYPYSQQTQQQPQQQQQRFSSSGSGHESDDKDTSSKERDSAYWERRRKNNEAAKRSRDARRAKEDEIAIRAAFLEQENLRLKYQVAALSDETAKLRCILYSSQDHKPAIHSSASA
ncbi:Basic region leucine zipper [Nesidiocoris tenuis]|uniref:Basic region leucine zipper n=1 Tax=Nesidiocoris tenuis TaxID=355587 RepID=A0ABN7AYD0_9HEMI|nr:Basic region leucine zipper [Nesidiocoris tenuis]